MKIDASIEENDVQNLDCEGIEIISSFSIERRFVTGLPLRMVKELDCEDSD